MLSKRKVKLNYYDTQVCHYISGMLGQSDDIYKISTESGELELSKKELGESNISRLSKNQYHILADGQSILGEVHHVDLNLKTVTIEHNSRLYTFHLESALDQQVATIKKSSAQKNHDLSIKSSMPGLVLDVLIEQEESIEEGQPVMILEAMKMENVIKAKFSGTIKKIHCAKGDAIDKGQLLIEFHPKA